LVVTTSARSQGLGNALLDAVDAELARLGITASFIGVMVGNDDAERLYARRGYMPVITKMMRLTEAKPS
ncbi:MAG: GNAT family N-acetyltransferase, partial [Actinomycetes bacterium]